MNWLEKCDPRHYLDVTGWDQLYQALPQPEKHLNNLSKVKLLILKVNTISIYLKPWIISNNKKRGNYITMVDEATQNRNLRTPSRSGACHK